MDLHVERIHRSRPAGARRGAGPDRPGRGHGDHIGDTVAIAEATGAKVALNADIGHTFAALGWLPYKQMVRFNKGGTITPIGPGVTVTIAGWIEGANVGLVQLALIYGDNDNRAMLIYKSLLTGDGYSVKGISTSQASNMQDQLNTVIENSSEVISDSTFGGGNFRTVLITKG